MSARCLLYYITDRTAFADDEPTRRRRLLEKIAEAARAGVDYIQLREKDLSARDLESLARKVVSTIRGAGKLPPAPCPLPPALLINSRTDIALAVEADGVHLRSDDVTPEEARKIWKLCSASIGGASLCGAGTLAREISPASPLIAVSCHSPAAVIKAAASHATFAVLAPVFEKKVSNKKAVEKKGFEKDAQPTGLELLHEACQTNIPVLALGGITLENAHSCLAAGAAGIAAIRLFQENDMTNTVESLRRRCK